MVYALLLASGKKAVNLGAEMPVEQLVRAVQQVKPVAVGLTFSAAYSYKLIRAHLHELRNHLVREVEIWVGGDGVQRMRKLPAGVVKFTTLDQLKF
jgi:methanogenic corrinoid protein MtbC1